MKLWWRDLLAALYLELVAQHQTLSAFKRQIDDLCVVTREALHSIAQIEAVRDTVATHRIREPATATPAGLFYRLKTSRE